MSSEESLVCRLTLTAHAARLLSCCWRGCFRAWRRDRLRWHRSQPGPKWELYGGYSFFHPGADIHGVLPLGLLPVSSRLEPNPRGVGASVTYDFNRWLGITLDSSTAWNSGEVGTDRVDDTALSNLSIGPKFTFRHRHFSPFLEVLVGDHRLMPDAFHDIQKLGVMAGGGLDLNSDAARRVADAPRRFCLLQLPLRSSGDHAGNRNSGRKTADRPEFHVWRRTGAVAPECGLRGRSHRSLCRGTGERHARMDRSFNPARTVQYSWSGSGVSVASTNSSTQMDTAGLQPGSYTVSAHLADGSKRGVASCAAIFLVKRPHPPEISCTADPGTVMAGNSASIRSQRQQSRPSPAQL